jgi:hypothetical protein
MSRYLSVKVEVKVNLAACIFAVGYLILIFT